MIFDDRIDRERLEQFASQVKHLAPTLLKDLDNHFKKDQSPAFYQGLLSAYCNSYLIMKNKSPGSEEEQTLGAIVAYLSNEIIQNEWYI